MWWIASRRFVAPRAFLKGMSAFLKCDPSPTDSPWQAQTMCLILTRTSAREHGFLTDSRDSVSPQADSVVKSGERAVSS